MSPDGWRIVAIMCDSAHIIICSPWPSVVAACVVSVGFDTSMAGALEAWAARSGVLLTDFTFHELVFTRGYTEPRYIVGHDTPRGLGWTGAISREVAVIISARVNVTLHGTLQGYERVRGIPRVSGDVRSAASGGRVRNTLVLRARAQRVCGCGQPAVRRSVQGGRNSGRDYLACGSRRCGFFRWVAR